MSKVSLRKSINAFCKSCIYDQNAGGTWKEQVKNCTSYTCSLYPVRPVQKVAKTGTNNTNLATIEA